MGLIDEKIVMKWNARNKKYYESRGYVYTKMKNEFEIKIEDLLKGSGIFINVFCDCKDCKNPYLKPMMWKDYLKRIKEDGKYYCQKCAIKLYASKNSRKTKLNNSKSFEQWCIENDKQNILDKWDYELNKYKPDEISYNSHGINNKGYWFRCINNSKHTSELKNINNFIKKNKNTITCNQCNSISTTHFYLIKYFKNKRDADKYSAYSSKRVSMKCPDCGHEKCMLIRTLVTQKFSCPKCGDRISYPNKFMFNILEQLNINFISEYSPKWIKRKRYDFYFELNNKKYIIEMDGGWHTKDNKFNGQTKEESKDIDDYKNKMAEEHNIEVVRINCCKSELEYIKCNIIKSKLNELFDLSKIDWNKCHEFICGNLIKKICNLWNSGIINPSIIAKELKLSPNTIRTHLKRGNKLGWCNYIPIKGKHTENNIVINNNIDEVLNGIV